MRDFSSFKLTSNSIRLSSKKEYNQTLDHKIYFSFLGVSNRPTLWIVVNI